MTCESESGNVVNADRSLEPAAIRGLRPSSRSDERRVLTTLASDELGLVLARSSGAKSADSAAAVHAEG